jgi:hypothetical protein
LVAVIAGLKPLLAGLEIAPPHAVTTNSDDAVVAADVRIIEVAIVAGFVALCALGEIGA